MLFKRHLVLVIFVFLSLPLFVSVTGFAGPRGVKLSPPWYLLQNRVMATIGKDQCVEVDRLELISSEPAIYELDIHQHCEDSKARALATLMTQDYGFGGVTVYVRVFDREGDLVPASPMPVNPKEAAEVVKLALGTNYYFVQIDFTNDPFKLLPAFYIEFKAEIVQYFADDISDYYSNRNEVVAKAFFEVLQLHRIQGIRIGTTTSRKIRLRSGNSSGF
jgi:hypothetical protein